MLSLGMVQVHAQTEKTTIASTFPQVLPGDRTYISFLLTNSGENSVTRLEHWIELPTSKISNVSTRLGIAANMIGAGLEVEETPQEEDTLILHLSIQGREPIPDGAVVEIGLDVAHIAPETLIVPHRVEAFDDQGEKISDLDFSDVMVHISHQVPDAPEAIFVCFFFMH